MLWMHVCISALIVCILKRGRARPRIAPIPTMSTEHYLSH